MSPADADVHHYRIRKGTNNGIRRSSGRMLFSIPLSVRCRDGSHRAPTQTPRGRRRHGSGPRPRRAHRPTPHTATGVRRPGRRATRSGPIARRDRRCPQRRRGTHTIRSWALDQEQRAEHRREAHRTPDRRAVALRASGSATRSPGHPSPRPGRREVRATACPPLLPLPASAGRPVTSASRFRWRRATSASGQVRRPHLVPRT